MSHPALPASPLERFLEIHEVLQSERGWLDSGVSLQFAAVSLVTAPGEPAQLAARVRAIAGELRKHAGGWLGDLSSPLRFLIAANLLRTGESPEAFCAAIAAGSALFREHRLRRGALYEAIAILILREQSPEGILEAQQVARFQALYTAMKARHWWLTGPDDYPFCALLCARKEPPAEIGRGVEALYLGLQQRRLASG